MSRYICIHGHFYQPPRENPWTGAIEPQESAKPFRNWNERITAECYHPNLLSKILGPKGKVIATLNNYTYMNFNFGPTLLSWMQEHAPDTYEGILRSDQESQKKFSGHGSAIAQAYNHMIMPLANPQDKKTQVYWGIKDFEFRFKRFPEGMWLPETAVDVKTLEILAEYNIKYTILAMHQAKRVRRIGAESWHDAGENRIDPHRSYICHLPSGRTIKLFFYDGDIAHGISFGNLLENGEVLAKHLIQKFHHKKGGHRLVHVATDGETYGHHKKFGELALSFCLDSIMNDYNAQMTIYGEYLEKFPTDYEVEIQENTSWSCAHGLERWRDNCGCKIDMTAKTQQKWRAPLRQALDYLRDELVVLYKEEMQKLGLDPWQARNEYIQVLLDQHDEAIETYFDEYIEADLSSEEEDRVIKLLEMQKFSMFMYTSCGWFFDDIAGLEAVQVLQYAARAIDLASQIQPNDLEKRFCAVLTRAPVNHPDYKNGAQVYQKLAKMIDHYENNLKIKI